MHTFHPRVENGPLRWCPCIFKKISIPLKYTNRRGVGIEHTGEMSIRRKELSTQVKPTNNRLDTVLRAGTVTNGPYNPLLDTDDEMTDTSIEIWGMFALSKIKKTDFYSRADADNPLWNKALEIIKKWKDNLPRNGSRQSAKEWLQFQVKSARMAEDALGKWYGVRDSNINSLIDAFKSLVGFYMESMPQQ